MLQPYRRGGTPKDAGNNLGKSMGMALVVTLKMKTTL